MGEHNAVVAICNTHTGIEAAIKLKEASFNVKKLSIVGKDYHTDKHVVGYYNTGDCMKYWGTAIPGIGQGPAPARDTSRCLAKNHDGGAFAGEWPCNDSSHPGGRQYEQ